jgi:hypothetical protein
MARTQNTKGLGGPSREAWVWRRPPRWVLPTSIAIPLAVGCAVGVWCHSVLWGGAAAFVANVLLFMVAVMMMGIQAIGVARAQRLKPSLRESVDRER